MKKYTFSYRIEYPSTREVTKPHSVWWRRWLGQSIKLSEPIKKVTRRSTTFEADPELVERDDFQKTIVAMAKGQKPGSTVSQFQLEEGSYATSYIPTTMEPVTRQTGRVSMKNGIVTFEHCGFDNGDIVVEPQRTNLIINSDNP